MKVIKKVLKGVLCFSLIPITYLIVSLGLSSITVDRKADNVDSDKSIYLSTNGIHLDIVIPRGNFDSLLLAGIEHEKTDNYLSFGWGEENFYLNTATWEDLTFSNAFRAMFLKSTTLMHVTRHRKQRSGWVEIKVNESESQKLNSYLLNTFKTNENGMKIILKNKGYSTVDDFYIAKGSYNCFKTCNSWVNSGFKKSGLKSCLWTPFDFGLLNKHE